MAELKIERLFDAPRDVVYKAFMDPDELAQWFGPIGFTCPRETIEVDPVVGGTMKMTMRGDDNPEAGGPSEGVFLELVENELIVTREEFNQEMAAVFGASSMIMRIELVDKGEQTLLRLTQGPYSDDFEKMARAGWNSSFTKLDNLFLDRLGLLELHQS